jgi:nitrous oxidase accessory protein NosD
MFGKKNTKNDEKDLARLITQECKYVKYSEKEILDAARNKAARYGDEVMYYLRIWESKASCGGFSLDRERV